MVSNMGFIGISWDFGTISSAVKWIFNEYTGVIGNGDAVVESEQPRLQFFFSGQLHQFLELECARWCPPVVSWFKTPLSLTMDISTITPSCWSYKPLWGTIL